MNNLIKPVYSLFLLFFVTIMVEALFHDLAAQTASQLIGQGDAFHKQFDTYNAYKSYKSASETDSTNFEALWKMANELIEMGNELPKSPDQKTKYAEAESMARRAVQLNPNHSKGHLVLAMAIEKVALNETGGDRIRLLNRLHAEAEKGLAINPQEDGCHHLLGRWNRTITNIGWLSKTWLRIFSGSFPQASGEHAIDHFKKAISINANDLSHYLELGKTYVYMEKWNDAKEGFEKVMTLPIVTKSDRKWQRDANNYLELLKTANYSELKDAVQE